LSQQILSSFDRVVLLFDMFCKSFKSDVLFLDEILNNIFKRRFLIHSNCLYEKFKLDILTITIADNVLDDS
jgi:hypothetical protein